jgi:hypothetical protein
MTAATAPNVKAVHRPADLIAGDGLLHPAAFTAIAVLVLNDHLLKAAWPGLVTGKLSDFAGLLFFPLFLQAAWEVVRAVAGRPMVGSRRVLILAIVLTAVVFAAIKTVPIAADAYSLVLGFLQWLVGIAPAVLASGHAGSPHRVFVAMDPTDLVALSVVAIAYRIGIARIRVAEA